MEEGTHNLVAAVRELNTALGIPAQVRQLKVDAVQYRAHLPSMAANALEDICTQSNPRMPSLDDLAELLLRGLVNAAGPQARPGRHRKTVR